MEAFVSKRVDGTFLEVGKTKLLLAGDPPSFLVRTGLTPPVSIAERRRQRHVDAGAYSIPVHSVVGLSIVGIRIMACSMKQGVPLQRKQLQPVEGGCIERIQLSADKRHDMGHANFVYLFEPHLRTEDTKISVDLANR